MSNYWIFPVFLPNTGCPHRCTFCDQHAVTGEDTSLPEIRDLDVLFEKVRFGGKRRDDLSLTRQIAFYGGNFSGLPREVQQRYLDWAEEKVTSGMVHSLRFSTRPDALNEEELAFLDSYPVKTIEIGVQSLNDRVLNGVQRGHTAQDCEGAVSRVVAHGWEAGVQLMPGLPGETRESFLNGVERISCWDIRFVRLYPAVVLGGTRLAEDYERGVYTPLTLEEAVTWCAAACEILEPKGIEVIRLGLPASRRLREAVVAGPYHPALGFLVQSYRFHRHIDEKVGACAPVKGEAVEIYIAPRSLPLLMGDRRQAWERLHARWPGKVITYHLDPTFTGGQIKVVTSPLS